MGMEKEELRQPSEQECKGFFYNRVNFFKKNELYEKIKNLKAPNNLKRRNLVDFLDKNFNSKIPTKIIEHFTFDKDHPYNSPYIDIVFDERNQENSTDYSYRQLSVECFHHDFFLYIDDKENTRIELTKANVVGVLKRQFKQEGVRIFPNLLK